jgi:hydroxymethylglutaryl-CoA lyase
MSDLPKKITITEVGPRDGLQMERKVLSVDEKVGLIDALADAGLTEIEVGSFVHPVKVPQMANTGEVFARLTKRPGTAYRALWLNLKGLERAIDNTHVDVHGKLSITTSETFLKRNVNSTWDDSFAAMPAWLEAYRRIGLSHISLGVMTAFGCTYEGHIPEQRTVALIERARQVVADSGLRLNHVDLADTTGWANPVYVQRVVGAIRERWPEMRIKLHLHDTRGAAVANAMAGMALGVDEFDGSIGGLGGCPFAGLQGSAGNICTEDLAFVCAEMGIETGLDLDKLANAARLAETLVERPLPGKVFRAGHRRPSPPASTVPAAMEAM